GARESGNAEHGWEWVGSSHAWARGGGNEQQRGRDQAEPSQPRRYSSNLQQRQRRGGVPQRPRRVVESRQHASQGVQASNHTCFGARVHDETGRGNDRVRQKDYQRATESAAEREQSQ